MPALEFLWSDFFLSSLSFLGKPKDTAIPSFCYFFCPFTSLSFVQVNMGSRRTGSPIRTDQIGLGQDSVTYKPAAVVSAAR